MPRKSAACFTDEVTSLHLLALLLTATRRRLSNALLADWKTVFKETPASGIGLALGPFAHHHQSIEMISPGQPGRATQTTNPLPHQESGSRQ